MDHFASIIDCDVLNAIIMVLWFTDQYYIGCMGNFAIAYGAENIAAYTAGQPIQHIFVWIIL